MDENEKRQTFGEIVNATVTLATPWRKLCYWLIAALVILCLALSGVIFYQARCAYILQAQETVTETATAQQ
jgi:hypothetical protein